MWKIIHYFRNSEQPHQSSSWKTKKLQMWFLWKMLHSIRIFEETHKNGSWRPKKSWMWVLWEAFSYIRQFEITHKAILDGRKNQNCDSCSKSFFSKGQLTFDKSHQNSSWSANNVIISYCRKYIHFQDHIVTFLIFSDYAIIFLTPMLMYDTIALIPTSYNTRRASHLWCSRCPKSGFVGTQNHMALCLYGIFFSIWICICSKSNCTFLHFVLWKFIK